MQILLPPAVKIMIYIISGDISCQAGKKSWQLEGDENLMYLVPLQSFFQMRCFRETFLYPSGNPCKEYCITYG